MATATARHTKKFRIKKGDTVEVVQGKENAKRGKVLHVLEAEERIVVERVNFIKRHIRPSKKTPQGGVIEREASMHISNVKLVCPSCNNAVRVGVRMEGEDKIRYCKKCNVQVDKG
ncbi:MAG: 50S ribosomal protein L24 [Actinobacteria bacterium RBG_16_64_13]|nr:MAG: 50S ribosomal protein L24 [Actinobacteria bacterium RBG_16_64_13]